MPSTIAAAISRWMLPWYSSSATGGSASSTSDQRPPSHAMSASIKRFPEPQEQPPRQRAQRPEQERDRWRVAERAQGEVARHRPAVQIVEVDRPVRVGVVANAMGDRGHDDQRETCRQPAADDQPVAHRPAAPRGSVGGERLERRRPVCAGRHTHRASLADSYTGANDRRTAAVRAPAATGQRPICLSAAARSAATHGTPRGLLPARFRLDYAHHAKHLSLRLANAAGRGADPQPARLRA